MNDSKSQRPTATPELAKRMEAARVAIGLTYQTLADRSGITSAGNTQAYCKATKRLPKKHLLGVARALGWPTSGVGWQQLEYLHTLWVGEKMPRTRALAEKAKTLAGELEEARQLLGLLLPSAIRGEKPSEEVLRRIERFVSRR